MDTGRQVELGSVKPPPSGSLVEVEDVRVVTENQAEKYSKDDDEAMKAYAMYQGPPLVLDEVTNKRLLRTIDWHLMPILQVNPWCLV